MRRVAMILLALPLLGACTETKLLDTIGAGKLPPDETATSVNRQLVMPPDMNLPAPKDADQEVATKTAALDPAPANVVTSPPMQSAQGVDDTPIVPGTNMTFQQQQDAIYAKYGISKTKPDGTPKTFDELSAEVRAAAMAEKRRQNPNYGTIWNFGSLFSE